MHQYATLEDTLYFWFAANDTDGTAADGETPVYDVRLAGAAANAAPVLSGSATLLTHANYPAGCHEVAIAATAANGFAANGVYGVFCTLLVDSQNPTGFVGSFQLSGVKLNAVQPAITWGQQKIVANAATEGALDIYNSNATGYGALVTGTLVGAKVDGTTYGATVTGTTALALTGTISPDFAIQGDAMTLTAAYDAAKTAAPTGAAMTLATGERTTLYAGIWAYVTRTLTSFGTLVADIVAAIQAAGSTITITAPVSADGTLLTLIRGDDYNATDGQELDFSSTGYPTLTGATITFTVERGGIQILTCAGSVVSATEARVELTAAQTALLPTGTRSCQFDVQAALVTSGHIVTLARGDITVLEDYT